MSDQRARQARAERMVRQLSTEKANGARALLLLRQAAVDERNLHYTPHLVTALRDHGFWPEIERAAATEKA